MSSSWPELATRMEDEDLKLHLRRVIISVERKPNFC